jgi:hypothetical protein
MIYFIDQSYMKPSEKTSVPDRSTFEIKHYIIRDKVQKEESGSPIHISTDEQISRHFGKASVQDERVCVLKLELVETTSSLKKDEMTPRLGESTNVLLIDGQSLFNSKNGPGRAVPFQFGKWFEISDGQTFSSSEKWSRSNGHFCNENSSMDC